MTQALQQRINGLTSQWLAAKDALDSIESERIGFGGSMEDCRAKFWDMVRRKKEVQAEIKYLEILISYLQPK